MVVLLNSRHYYPPTLSNIISRNEASLLKLSVGIKNIKEFKLKIRFKLVRIF